MARQKNVSDRYLAGEKQQVNVPKNLATPEQQPRTKKREMMKLRAKPKGCS